MAKGCFIVIEGIEGAGKSTALAQVKNILEEKNLPVLVTREPGGTEIGEILRHIIKGKSSNEILDIKAELLLFYAARVQLVETIIKPALEQGYIVLSDRFELSSFAYQGRGRGTDMQFLSALSKFCLNGFVPDLTIFLDISPENGLKRVYNRGKVDRIEQESVEFFRKVHGEYHEQLKKIPRDKYKVINAGLALSEVQKEIAMVLEDFINQSVLTEI